jgi:hypothetical protein
MTNLTPLFQRQLWNWTLWRRTSGMPLKNILGLLHTRWDIPHKLKFNRIDEGGKIAAFSFNLFG